jgi:hypothetical protein
MAGLDRSTGAIDQKSSTLGRQATCAQDHRNHLDYLKMLKKLPGKATPEIDVDPSLLRINKQDDIKNAVKISQLLKPKSSDRTGNSMQLGSSNKRFGKSFLAKYMCFVVLAILQCSPFLFWVWKDTFKVCKPEPETAPTALMHTQNETVDNISSNSLSLYDKAREMSRIAYLITVNATSPRTLRSTNILKNVGFDVRLEFAPPVDDKVISNKLAQLSIYRQIALAPEGTGGVDGWGYIFEDDIILVGKTIENFDDKVDFSVAETLLETEKNETLFIYLGICGPERQHVVSGPSRYCGSCAHAYGVSRKGAMALLEYEESRKSERYMDVLMRQWCKEMGGFCVVNAEKQSNQAADHFGTFIQDRRAFPTLIG